VSRFVGRASGAAIVLTALVHPAFAVPTEAPDSARPERFDRWSAGVLIGVAGFAAPDVANHVNTRTGYQTIDPHLFATAAALTLFAARPLGGGWEAEAEYAFESKSYDAYAATGSPFEDSFDSHTLSVMLVHVWTDQLAEVRLGLGPAWIGAVLRESAIDTGGTATRYRAFGPAVVGELAGWAPFAADAFVKIAFRGEAGFGGALRSSSGAPLLLGEGGGTRAAFFHFLSGSAGIGIVVLL
jgi:hypothetical protein